jgi:Na+-translocating ferredoxin:NAD+ oxidoreductase RnfG subunit
MIQSFLIALLVMALISAGAILIAVLQGKRAKKAEAENKALHEAFWQVEKKAERLQKALGENAKVEEEADAKRTELSRTPDSGLAGRANDLFVQDNGSGKPAGNAGPVTAAGTGSAGDGTGSI